MKSCRRFLIFEVSDCSLRIFRGYDFSIFLKYFYFWIDIFGVLTQTFEPVPRMFSYGVPPWVIISTNLYQKAKPINHKVRSEGLTRFGLGKSFYGSIFWWFCVDIWKYSRKNITRKTLSSNLLPFHA